MRNETCTGILYCISNLFIMKISLLLYFVKYVVREDIATFIKCCCYNKFLYNNRATWKICIIMSILHNLPLLINKHFSICWILAEEKDNLLSHIFHYFCKLRNIFHSISLTMLLNSVVIPKGYLKKLSFLFILFL